MDDYQYSRNATPLSQGLQPDQKCSDRMYFRQRAAIAEVHLDLITDLTSSVSTSDASVWLWLYTKVAVSPTMGHLAFLLHDKTEVAGPDPLP